MDNELSYYSLTSRILDGRGQGETNPCAKMLVNNNQFFLKSVFGNGSFLRVMSRINSCWKSETLFCKQMTCTLERDDEPIFKSEK